MGISSSDLDRLKDCLRKFADDGNYEEAEMLCEYIERMEENKNRKTIKPMDEFLSELGLPDPIVENTKKKHNYKRITVMLVAALLLVTLVIGQTIAAARGKNIFELVRDCVFGSVVFITAGDDQTVEAFCEYNSGKKEVITIRELCLLIGKPILTLDNIPGFTSKPITKTNNDKGIVFWQTYNNDEHYILLMGENSQGENCLSNYTGGAYEEIDGIIYAPMNDGNLAIREYEGILYRYESNLSMEELKNIVKLTKEVLG